MMTFAKEVKEEIVSLDFSSHCAKALLTAYLKNALEISINEKDIKWEIVSQAPFILRFIFNQLNALYKIDKEFLYSNKKMPKNSRMYKMIITGDLNKIEKDLKLFYDDPHYKSECCKRAFVAGLFLSGGSVNSPKSKTYHLEFKLKNVELKNTLEKLLKEIKIDSKSFIRKEKYILYVKKSNYISDILKFMSAQNSMFIYEDKRIFKDFANQVHRLNNLDISNLKKTIDASQSQIKYINWIMNHEEEFKKLKIKEKNFCKIRLRNQELSLSELSIEYERVYQQKLSKGAIHYYIKKIKNIYENRIS
ncbi:MAG: DNA-binding protein WhiA [Mycoplasmoidaceae bacterium]